VAHCPRAKLELPAPYTLLCISSPQLQLTLKLKWNYHLNPKAGKAKIVNHLRCLIFPDNLWTDVLLGCFIDLNKVYSRYYALDTNYQSSQTIGDFNISFANGSNISKPVKLIKMNGDWGIAFRQMKHAILFTYSHHSEELNKYEEYIVGQFTGVVVSQHSRVLNLDWAIRLHESQSNHLLTSFNAFSDLIMTHLINPQGSSSSQGVNKHAKGVADPNAPVCRHWNLGNA